MDVPIGGPELHAYRLGRGEFGPPIDGRALVEKPEDQACAACCDPASTSIGVAGHETFWCSRCLGALSKAVAAPVPGLAISQVDSSPFPPFREGELCMKCGGSDLTVEWVEKSPFQPHVAPTPEHLAVACRRCRFGVRRAPLDLAPGTVAEPWPLLDLGRPRPSEVDLERDLWLETESTRLKNVFFQENIRTVGELASLTETEFRQIRNVGNVGVRDSRRILERRNLRFRRPGERVLRPR